MSEYGYVPVGDNRKMTGQGLKKPEVIFICSSGHSGSTLLDMILGSNKNTFSVGEIRNWNKYFTDNRPEPSHEKQRFDMCTCGADLDTDECEFWSMIKKKKLYKITNPDDKRLKNKMFKYLIGKESLNRITSVNYDYLRMLHIIMNNAGVNKIIDSSKNIQWLLQLVKMHRLGFIKLKVISLTREAAGVFYSHKKIGRDPYKELVGGVYINVARKLLVNREKIPNINIRYKDIILKNDETINQLSEYLDLDLSDWKNDMNNTTFHNIGGNPMRFKEFKGLRLDRKWKYKLNMFEKTICKLIEVLR